MSSVLRSKVPTLNAALEALTFRSASDINLLTHFKALDSKRAAYFKCFIGAFRTEFPLTAACLYTSFGVVTCLSFAYSGCFT